MYQRTLDNILAVLIRDNEAMIPSCAKVPEHTRPFDSQGFSTSSCSYVQYQVVLPIGPANKRLITIRRVSSRCHARTDHA